MINLLSNPQQTRTKSQSHKDLDVTFITSQIIERSRQGQLSSDDTQLFTYFYQKHPFIATLNHIAQLNLLNDYIPVIQFVEIDSNVLIMQNGEIGDKFYGLVSGKITHPHLCFGVEALNEVPYQADVQTLEKSKFLVIERQNFISIITKAKLNEKHGQIDFFRESQIFAKLSKRSIASFLHLFQLTFFRKNQVIYRERDASDFVYMIREGEIELSKQFEIKNKFKQLPVSTLGKLELFGDMDCLFNTCRQYTAKCKEQAYCYKITNENFYQIIQKNPQSGIENYINTVMRTQTISRMERLETASSVISGNRNLLLGMEEVKKQNPKDEKKRMVTWSSEKNNRIIQRYTPIYNNSNRKKMRVRCATLYNDQPVVRCAQKQTERTDRHEQLLKLKGQLFDEIEIPDRIKRKYQAQLLALKQQTLRRQMLIIRTQNNESKIMASQMFS